LITISKSAVTVNDNKITVIANNVHLRGKTKRKEKKRKNEMERGKKNGKKREEGKNIGLEQ
jgi:hypothetical protein